MKNKYDIHIDESGDPIFSMNSSKYLVFSSIITHCEKTETIRAELQIIKERYKLKEFKSSKISSEKRRIDIFKEIKNLDFRVLTLFILKDKIIGDWRTNKKVFYKYTQKLLHSELHKIFENKTVILDRFGSIEYQVSLKNYLDKQLNLFNETVIISSAKNENLIQLADLFSGTFRKFYLNEFIDVIFFKNLFKETNLRTIIFPDSLSKLNFDGIYNNDDKQIAKITIKQAEQFLNEIQNNILLDPNRIILEYLLFHAKYNDKKIYTPELIDWLKYHGYSFSEENFRGAIIGKLRDSGVIIAGSRNGIKIPISSKELTEYFSFTSNKIIPMIKRLSISYDVLNSRSNGSLSILNDDHFDLLKDLFEIVRQHQINR